MTTYIGLFGCDILLVLIITTTSVNSQYGCDNPSGVVVGGDYCYTIHEQKLGWTASSDYCASQGGQLPVVMVSMTSLLLRNLLRNYTLNDTWLGASADHFENYDWFWISDRTRVDLQGCYKDVFASPDLPDSYLLTAAEAMSVTDTLCISECANPSDGHVPYKYAGLQSGDTCYCGDDYGKNWQHSLVKGCSLPCIGDTDRDKCGGFLKNYVYYVNGSYAEWTVDQPDGQLCAVIDSLIGDRRLYSDEHCNSEYSFICQIGDASSCPSTTGYQTTGGNCYYISPESTYNWFEAQEQCVQKGGNLVKISDEAERLNIETMLENSGATAAHWIGLTRMSWKWKTASGNGEPISFSDWSTSLRSPAVNISITQEFCLLSAAADDYRWNSGICSQNLSVICQYDYHPTTTASSSTASTTTSSSGTQIQETTTSAVQDTIDTKETTESTNSTQSPVSADSSEAQNTIQGRTESIDPNPATNVNLSVTQDFTQLSNELNESVTQPTYSMKVDQTTSNGLQGELSNSTRHTSIIENALSSINNEVTESILTQNTQETENESGATVSESPSAQTTSTIATEIETQSNDTVLTQNKTSTDAYKVTTTDATSQKTVESTTSEDITTLSSHSVAENRTVIIGNQPTADQSEQLSTVTTDNSDTSTTSSTSTTTSSSPSPIVTNADNSSNNNDNSTTSPTNNEGSNNSSNSNDNTTTSNNNNNDNSTSSNNGDNSNSNTTNNSNTNGTSSNNDGNNSNSSSNTTNNNNNSTSGYNGDNNNNNNSTSALIENTVSETTSLDSLVTTAASQDGISTTNSSTVGNPEVGQSTGDDGEGLSDFQIVLIVAFCILAVAIVVTTALFVYLQKKKGQQVAPASGVGYADKSPAVASGSHGNGDVPRSEDGSTVGLVMKPDNDLFT